MPVIRLMPAGADAPVDVELTPVRGESGRYVIEIEDRTHEVSVDADAGVMQIGDAVVPYRAARDGSAVWTWTRDGHARFDVVERTAQRSGDAAGAAATDRLVAPMPGTILKINVTAGEAFDADAPLVIMESMKMEMTLSAPRAGTVAAVECAEGDLVAVDQLLVQFADPGETDE